MFIDLGETRVAYDISGDGDPLVLVCGFGANRRFWKDEVPQLNDRFTVVTVDPRGAGETEYSGSFTIDDIADDVAALMHGLGFDRFFAIGWSMGTSILQSLAARYPGKVIAQALISTFSQCPSRSSYLLGEFARMVYDGTASMESFCVAVNAFCLPESTFRNAENAGVKIPVPRHPGDPKGLLDQYSATETFCPGEYLSRITAPTLIVQGTEDIMTPFRNGESVRDMIVGAELYAVEGAGHKIPSDEYLARVLDFFRRRVG